MATRSQKIEPYKSGQSSNEHVDKTPPVKVNANMSSLKDAGTQDGLHAALGHRVPLLPSDHHVWTHTTTIEPVGARYTPMGEFGSRQPTGKGKGVYSYGGAPNKKGENALGKAMNKVGEKSGYKKFTPKGGGKKP